ncbi:MAG: hypothetical protein E4H13_12550, partial [Calditrichales bacterium]
DDWRVIWASTQDEVKLHLLEDAGFGAVLVDHTFIDADFSIIGAIKKINPYVRIIVVTETWRLESVRIAMNRGVFDYLVYPVKKKSLLGAIDKAISQSLSRINAATTRQKLLSLQRELDIAGRVQDYIQPGKTGVFKGCTIGAQIIPTRSIGGDFFDFFQIDENRIGLLLGDVSGKGIPAALFMAMTKSLIKLTAVSGTAPDECLRRVNVALCKDNPSMMFATVFYAILNLDSRELAYCNAGHEMPFLMDRNGEVRIVPRTGDMALGFDETSAYHCGQIVLNPGDILYLFTDGVNEATNQRKTMYGKKRLQNIMTMHRGDSPEVLVKEILEDVTQFSYGAPQSDDITMLALGIDDQKDTVFFKLQNEIEQLTILQEKINLFDETNNLPFAIRHALDIVLEELFTNIINYAFPAGENHEIEYHITLSGIKIEIEIRDDGMPFDPAQPRSEKKEEPVEQRQIGGWGLQIVHKYMDKINYTRLQGHNVVRLIKYITESKKGA